MIEAAKDLMAVREMCRWPPAGNRGVAFSRANLFGKNFESYKEEAQSPFLVAMIENVRACNNLKEILAVEGLDAILIGPYDLSASLGVTGELDHPDFISTMEKIRRSAFDANIPAGVHVVSPSISQLNARIEEGYLFMPYSIDTVVLRNEIEKVVGALRDEGRGY
jgi:2-dehydro-3-deoxyglucarate aldolase